MPPCMSAMLGGAGQGDVEAGLELVGDVERAVDDRHLEVDGAALAAAVDEPHLAVVVLRQAPLAAVGRRSARGGRPPGVQRRRKAL